MEPKKSLSALGGLKRTAQPPTPTRTEEPATPDTIAEPGPAPLAETQRPTAPVSPVKAGGGAPSPTAAGKEEYGNLTVRGPKILIQAFEAHKEKTKLSFPNVLFNAIDATIEVLPDLLASRRVAVPKANLFGRPETVSVVEEDHSEKHSKSMRIGGQHMQVLNDLARDYAGDNRNRLIVTALTEYLKEDIENIKKGQRS